jgi:hypothetical protein
LRSLLRWSRRPGMILIAPLLTLCQFGNLKSGIPEGKLKDGVETERLV